MAQPRGRIVPTLRKTFALLLVFSFCSIAFQPCSTSVAQAGLPSLFLPREKNKDSFEAICNIISSDGTQEIHKNISAADIILLNELYQHDQQAFLEKAHELGLLGNTTVPELTVLIYQNEGNAPSSQNTTVLTNQNCQVKFSGSLFQTYYLPIPYPIYNFMVKAGIPLLEFFVVALFIILSSWDFPILAQFLQKLWNLLVQLGDLLSPMITALVGIALKAISLVGWIHSWAPVKFPFRNMVLTKGNFHMETQGSQGYWNQTGTMSVMLVGFKGLWISLPPVSIPPYTPTWCLGRARLVTIGGP